MKHGRPKILNNIRLYSYITVLFTSYCLSHPRSDILLQKPCNGLALHPGGVVILKVDSCHRTWVELQPCGPPVPLLWHYLGCPSMFADSPFSQKISELRMSPKRGGLILMVQFLISAVRCKLQFKWSCSSSSLPVQFVEYQF